MTLRNHLFANSRKVVDESKLVFKEVACWLDADPTFLYEREQAAVVEAKELLRRGSHAMTPGRLISELGLGFWCSLCRSPYEQGRPAGPGLWPALLGQGFAFLPKDQKSRPHIRERFDEIREIRNRVFHHEPVWDRNIKRSHHRIVAAISWMNHGVAAAVDEVSRVEAVADRGVAGYREFSHRKSEGPYKGVPVARKKK